MPRNTRKKFRKFLEARRHRLHRPTAIGSAEAMVLDVVCALAPPGLFALLLWAMWGISLLYITKPLIFAAALALLIFWAVLAYRGVRGFWPYRADFLFAVATAALVLSGTCWGAVKAVPAKVWVTPPSYARIPTIELDEAAMTDRRTVLEGSTVHISWLSEDPPPVALLDGREEALEPSVGVDVSSTLTVPATGQLRTAHLLLQRGWRKIAAWPLEVVPDERPHVSLEQDPEITSRKTIKFVYKTADDYGVETLAVRIAPTSSASGVSTEPVEISLENPGVKSLDHTSYADLTSLPWAGIPVTVQLVAIDGAGQKGWSQPKIITLPTRAFRNPFARALIEERQKFLETPDAAVRDEAANVMAGIARQQGLYRGDPVVLMALRAGAVRLVLNTDPQTPQTIADLLWKVAVRLEDGPVGQARADLADAQRLLSLSLLRASSYEGVVPLIVYVRQSMDRYFDVLESERARHPPALQGMDWPLATASEMLTPEDLQARLTVIAEQLQRGERGEARQGLVSLQSMIENLRTSPPELTPEQSEMAQQIFAIKALVREQKALLDLTDRLSVTFKDKTARASKERQTLWARALAQQQLILSALRDLTNRQGMSLPDLATGEEAMRRAVGALQKNSVDDARKGQEEAATLLESGLNALTEKMRRAMTVKAP